MSLIWIAHSSPTTRASRALSLKSAPGTSETKFDAIYASRRFWPEPLITINPHFERGVSINALVADGSLHPDVTCVFRVDGQSITLYRHQVQAVAKATACGRGRAAISKSGRNISDITLDRQHTDFLFR